MEEGIVKADSWVFGLGDWVGGSATHENWGEWRRKSEGSCELLGSRHVELEVLVDIQVEMFNRELENKTRAVESLN